MLKISALDDMISGFNYKISKINKFLDLIDDSIELPKVSCDKDNGISLCWNDYSTILYLSFYDDLEYNCWYKHIEIDHTKHSHRYVKYDYVKDVDCLPMGEILDLLNKHFKKD